MDKSDKKKNKHDWKKLKMAFVRSNLSIAEFGRSNGIPDGTLRKRVSADKWMEERDRFGSATVEKSISKAIEDTSSQLAKFEDKTLRIIKSMQRKVEELADVAEKAYDVKTLTSTLIELQKGYRLALGASTENQAQQNGFDREEWLKRLSDEEIE